MSTNGGRPEAHWLVPPPSRKPRNADAATHAASRSQAIHKHKIAHKTNIADGFESAGTIDRDRADCVPRTYLVPNFYSDRPSSWVDGKVHRSIL